MTVNIKYSTDGGSTWSNPINYHTFEINNGLFRGQLAPKASFVTPRNVSISGNDLVQIVINTNVRFEGKTKSGGKHRSDGRKEYEVNGNGFDIMDEEVTISETASTPETIIDSVLPSDFSKSTSTSTGVTLDYNETKTRRSVIEDMLHRTGYVAWMDSVNKTLYFNPSGDRGSYGDWTIGTDDVVVPSFEEDDRSTLRNKVVIHGTKDGQDVTYTASNVLADYEEHKTEYNFDFVDNSTDAQKIAENLLIVEPYSNGKLMIADNLYNPQNLCNYNVTITDSSKNVSSVTLLVEEQKIEEQVVTLKVGKGVQYGRGNENLEVKSNEEKIGSGKQWSDVYDDGDKPENNASQNLVFSQDAVPSGTDGDLWFDTGSSDWYVCKLSSCSILSDWTKASDITGNKNQSFTWLTDSINETQISDDTIKAPMILSGEIIADHINSNTITANEIDTIKLSSAQDAEFGTGNNYWFKFNDGYNSSTALVPSHDTAECYIGTASFPFLQATVQQIEAFNHDSKEGSVIPLFDPQASVDYGKAYCGKDTVPWSEVHSYIVDSKDRMKIPVGTDMYG